MKLTSQLSILQDELEAERDRRQQIVQQFESVREEAVIHKSSASEAERRIRELQVQVDQGSEYVADLLEQLAGKERQISETDERANRLEREWIDFRDQLADERRRTVEIEDARLQLTSQLSMLQDELGAERDRRQQVVQQLESVREEATIHRSSAIEAERRIHALPGPD